MTTDDLNAQRARVRDVLPNVKFGKWPTGQLNSITDVPGVLVSVQSIQPERDINTGVTVILPRVDWHKYFCFAGIFSFNGCGEMTGSHWIQETGILTSPIVITGSAGIGDGWRGIGEYVAHHLGEEGEEKDIFMFPLVAETYDGFLSHLAKFALKPEHVIKGIKEATADRVPEGCTGGGTGMICHRFKGGTGSSSRKVQGLDAAGNKTIYTVGVLVQANYGSMENLHIAGVPVGRILKEQSTADITPEAREPRKDGSIIIVIGTDAPLTGVQLQRLAKRATIGLGKVGGYGSNTSGDIFLAFSTANKIPFQQYPMDGKDPYVPEAVKIEMSNNDTINGLFEAAADATEESIYNAMFMARTLTGYQGRTVEAIDLKKVQEIFAKRPADW